MKALLETGSPCNNSCVFCYEGAAGTPLSSDEILNRVASLARRGCDCVVLAGGEPAIRKDFFPLLEAIKALGLHAGLRTNGRVFSYPDFTREYLSCNPAGTTIVLFGSHDDSHDSFTGVAGSFRQSLKGIRELAGRTPRLALEFKLRGENISRISEMFALAGRLAPGAKVRFALPGEAGRGHGDIMPGPRAAAAGISHLINNNPNALNRISCRGFPPCLFDGFSGIISDAIDEDMYYCWPAEAGEPVAAETLRGRYFRECGWCSEHLNCGGVAGWFGEDNVRGVRTLLPNAVGYDYAESMEAAAAPSCPGGAAFHRSYDLLNTIAVLDGGALDIYRRADRRFGGSVVKKLKHDLDQVYANVAGRTKNLDFRQAFRRMRLCAECNGCENAPGCPGIYRLVEGNPFARVEEEEKERIAALSGRVLDVGCGEPLFPGLLKREVDAGRIEYTGIDINPPPDSGLNVINIDIEDYECENEYYDHVLCLRSYNHIKRPEVVFPRLAAMLKKGGRLHVFENSVFIVLKKNVREDLIEDYSKAYEHYRNHYLGEAAGFLSDATGLKVADAKPITSGTANQWFLVMEKS